MKRNVPLKRTERSQWRRKPEDRVPAGEANYVYARDDGRCLAPMLARKAGEPIDDCDGRLTLEHVKTESMIGKRAPSDRYHMILLCLWHNTGWALTHKDLERAYLRWIEGEAAA